MDERAARDRMVQAQIAGRGIEDARVLAAMREIPRHLFVDAELRREAYDDRPLPIGQGQTISQPYMVAVMTATLDVQPGHRVLEIGTGSGYQTAILATLASEVISLERLPALAARASETLAAIGIANVRVIVGDGTEGHPADGPYDRILVTAGAPVIPESLTAQLADGGRLVVPVGPAAHQRLIAIDRAGNRLTEQTGEACVFVPLIGRHGWPEA